MFANTTNNYENYLCSKAVRMSFENNTPLIKIESRVLERVKVACVGFIKYNNSWDEMFRCQVRNLERSIRIKRLYHKLGKIEYMECDVAQHTRNNKTLNICFQLYKIITQFSNTRICFPLYKIVTQFNFTNSSTLLQFLLPD